MKFLFLLWTVVRNAFEASVWATLVWTAAEPFYPIEWIYLFWIFFAILVLAGLGAIGAEPWPFLAIDPMLVGLATLQAAMCGLVLTLITIVVTTLIHIQTNWLHVFLFFACACYSVWRRSGKKKAVQSWKGEPWKTSELFKGPSPIGHLPEWQREKLTEHRQKRENVPLDRGVWTRASSDGSLVTELDLYWAKLEPSKGDNKFVFICYSKKSGQVAQMGFEYDTEKRAMDAAVAWMRQGQSPHPVSSGDVKANPTTEKQPENNRLKTEQKLVEVIDQSASKSAQRIVDFIPEGEKKADLTIKVYIEYLCFFLHVTNRLASKCASFQEVDRMYQTIAPALVEYVLHKIRESLREEHIQKAWREAITGMIKAREVQYAESTEYASKEWKPLSGTSTVDMLVRNIREILDTYNPVVLFQIQLAARHSVMEVKLPELIADYLKTHFHQGTQSPDDRQAATLEHSPVPSYEAFYQQLVLEVARTKHPGETDAELLAPPKVELSASQISEISEFIKSRARQANQPKFALYIPKAIEEQTLVCLALTTALDTGYTETEARSALVNVFGIKPEDFESAHFFYLTGTRL